jgi:hypothetical protein
MAVCTWCSQEMTTARTCSVSELHRFGTPHPMIPYGKEGGGWGTLPRCGDCGVRRGGFHHLGCDIQRCPVCRGQMMSCDCRFDEDDGPIGAGVDGNGDLVEIVRLGSQEVIVHHTESLPAKDRTEVRGIPVTTPLRTVIDLAPELEEDELEQMVAHCLARELFTVAEARARLAEDDMQARPGAGLLRALLLEPDGPSR